MTQFQHRLYFSEMTMVLYFLVLFQSDVDFLDRVVFLVYQMLSFVNSSLSSFSDTFYIGKQVHELPSFKQLCLMVEKHFLHFLFFSLVKSGHQIALWWTMLWFLLLIGFADIVFPSGDDMGIKIYIFSILANSSPIANRIVDMVIDVL